MDVNSKNLNNITDNENEDDEDTGICGVDEYGYYGYDGGYINYYDQIYGADFMEPSRKNLMATTFSCGKLSSYPTCKVWTKLEEFFASKTDATLVHLKSSLQTITKGNLSMADYIQFVRNIVDSLAASGHEISSTEFCHYVLKGLDSAYESI
ncbi:hypothetical protein C5167_037450, partial [Papaver somniferum]